MYESPRTVFSTIFFISKFFFGAVHRLKIKILIYDDINYECSHLLTV